MVSVDANLAQLRPALPPPLHHLSLLRPDFSLDIILENGSHTTNTQGIFQLYYLWRKNCVFTCYGVGGAVLGVRQLMENKCRKCPNI